MIIDSGYLIINAQTSELFRWPLNYIVYKNRKGAQRECDFRNHVNRPLRVVKVNIVIDETEEVE